MCGIAVAYNWDGAQSAVATMMAGMVHRGDVSDPVVCPRPDTAMATRRLRIVDAPHGQQPKISFDGAILVSFNGEIYNHAALRAEMEDLDIPFDSDCDTEVVANALRVWGAAAIRRFSGMFAFVALDMRNGEFLAARDPFGVKPLYVIQAARGFLFCSEIKPLLEASPTGDVMLLPAGHILTPALCAQYFKRPPSDPAFAPTAAELDTLLDQAVASRMPDTLPAAALFSGGIDSTLVMQYARRHQPKMPAYFVGHETAPDWIFAAAYAEQTGLDLRRVSLPDNAAEKLTLLQAVAQTVETFEPTVLRPSLAAWCASQAIHRDGFRVALCGEGADELFAGYSHLERAFAVDASAGRAVQEQSLNLMHRSNLQRLDRCGMRFEVEIREPLLDGALAHHALRLPAGALLRSMPGGLRGKEPLRALYDLYPADLPVMIRDRQKLAFDEGAGLEAGQWAGLFEQAVSETDLKDGAKEFAAFGIQTREELFYLRALAGAMDVHRVPHLKSRLQIVMPAAPVAAPAAARAVA
jgi:asparagine synthase (glutamine-hydrolysing)